MAVVTCDKWLSACGTHRVTVTYPKKCKWSLCVRESLPSLSFAQLGLAPIGIILKHSAMTSAKRPAASLSQILLPSHIVGQYPVTAPPKLGGDDYDSAWKINGTVFIQGGKCGWYYIPHTHT